MHVGKKVYVGLESSGKSLLMSREFEENLYRNYRWLQITGIPRPIYYNISISQSMIDLAAELGIPIHKWTNIWDLVSMSECDLYIDELATYFDSRFYQDLPLDVRLWLSQAEKMGVQIVGATQDYFMIDISFRRLVKQLHEVHKVVGSRRPMKTAPPVNIVWGIMFVWNLDPRSAAKAGNQEEMKTSGIFNIPKVTWLKKKDTKRFNTQTRVALSEPPPLKKYVRVCPEDGFRRVKYV